MNFLILLSFISVSFAAENTQCDIVVSSTAIQLAETFKPTKCLEGVNAKQFNKFFLKEDEKKKICGKCISPLANERIPSNQHRDKFIKASLNELRKGLSQTLLELMSLRSSLEMGLDGELLAKSCDISKIANSTECSKYPAIKNEIESIQSSLANELAGFIQSDISSPGLMDKTINKQCSVTDNEVLFVKNHYIENSLPDLMIALKKTKQPFGSVEFARELNAVWSESQSKVEISGLWSHPLIGPLLSNPEALKNFVSKSSSSPNVEELRSMLYGQDGAKAFSKNLKSKCDGYLEVFTKKICSNEVNDHNLAVDSKASLESLMDAPPSVNPPHLERTKEEIILICQDDKFKDKNTISFSNIQAVLTNGLPPDIKDLNYSTFKAEAYRGQIGVQKDTLCKINDGTLKCEPGTNQCDLFNIWKDSQKDGTKIKNLLGAHDSNIDKILRALIGEPKNIKDDTKQVLMAQGLLKNEKGSYAISDTPERKTDYYKTEAASIAPSTVANTKTNMASAKPVKTTQSATQDSPTGSQVSYPTNSPTSSDNQPLPFSSSSSADEEVRNNLQKQILDRLGKQVTSKQIEDMVAKAYNKGRATPMTQQQVEEKTKEVLEDMPTNSFGGSGGPMANNQGSAKVSVDKDREKKAQQLGFLKAKYGIDPNAPTGSKGAQGKAGSNGDENLKVVAVTNAAELKIVVGDFKNLKNAQIAELMKKQTPFILQIGKVAYKIAFQNGQLEIIPPKGVKRDPAAISNLQNYILNLAKAQPDRSLYNELMKVNFKG